MLFFTPETVNLKKKLIFVNAEIKMVNCSLVV